MKYSSKYVLLGLSLCLAISWTITSCDDVENVMKGRSKMLCTFVNKSDLKQKVLDSLTVTALKTVVGDSILLKSAKKVSTFSSPLSYVNNTTVLVFNYTKTMSDTIWINHTNKDHFISLNAGVAVYHQIESVKFSKHLIGDIQIINSGVETNEKENIRILY